MINFVGEYDYLWVCLRLLHYLLRVIKMSLVITWFYLCYLELSLSSSVNRSGIAALALGVIIDRSSQLMCSRKKPFLKNFAKLTRKHLCWSLFFNKIAGLGLVTLLKKRLRHRCFFTKYLQATTSI